MTLKKSIRTAVLDAAIALAQDSDISALTLDAVAARAGVSKGGLLHHFKSKEALLTAMVGRVVESFEDERRQAMEAESGAENALMATYIDRSFAGFGKRYKSAMILFAVAANQRGLLQPIREYFDARTRETVAQSENPAASLALTLLADGLWLFDALDIPPFSGALREQVHAFVRELVQRELGGTAPSRALLP